ncbi:flavodoxin [Clostridioides difficile]|nr:flavodoxin [Clostridioides difficile]
MNKVLIAYFSASGETKKLAERLAQEIGADLFEIKPESPYTNADLDWWNSKSRSSIEMNDRNCRPAISSQMTDMVQYDIVFVGFPIWWYREPSIIDTFMETFDFRGKTVIPFATSGGSEIGDSGTNLAALALGAKVESGKRFNVNASSKELVDWAKQWL